MITQSRQDLDKFLRLFDAGFSLVPLVKNDKRPLNKDWPNQELTRQDVKTLFAEGFSFGVRCDGLTVLDFDSKEPAREWFRRHLAFIRVVVVTNRGAHFWFKRSNDVGNRVSSICDVRSGAGGVVVGPGSVAKDYYYDYAPGYDRIKNLAEFQMDWLPSFPSTGRQKILKSEGDMVLRARQYVKTIESAKEGERDNKLFKVACILMQKFGLLQEQAWPILLEFNDRCLPPISNIKQLRRKLVEAKRLQ